MSHDLPSYDDTSHGRSSKDPNMPATNCPTGGEGSTYLFPGEKWIAHKFARLDDNTLLRHGLYLAVPSFKFGKLGLPLLEHFGCCVVATGQGRKFGLD